MWRRGCGSRRRRSSRSTAERRAAARLQCNLVAWLRERALAGQRAPDQQLLDLARAFVQRRDARVAEVLLHRELVDVAVAAVYLYRGIRRAYGHFARVVLRLRRRQRVRPARV